MRTRLVVGGVFVGALLVGKDSFRFRTARGP